MDSYVVENANELLHQQDVKFSDNSASRFYSTTPISAAAAAAAAAVAAASAGNGTSGYFPNPTGVFGSVTDDLFYRHGTGYYAHQQSAFAHPAAAGIDHDNGRNGHQQLYQMSGHAIQDNPYSAVTDLLTNAPCAYADGNRNYPVSEPSDTSSVLINNVIACSSNGNRYQVQKNGKGTPKASHSSKRAPKTPSPIVPQPSVTDLGQSASVIIGKLKSESGTDSPSSDAIGTGYGVASNKNGESGDDPSPKFFPEGSRANSSSISTSEDDEEKERESHDKQQGQQQSEDTNAAVTYPWMKRVHSSFGKQTVTLVSIRAFYGSGWVAIWGFCLKRLRVRFSFGACCFLVHRTSTESRGP